MRVVFMGSPEFAVPCLSALVGAKHDVALVVSQPDKPAGRGGQVTPPPVKAAALELGLPTLQPKSARTGELEAALRDSHAELAVVVAYGKILPRAVLDALPRGCINVHASLLPKYRGAAPVQWAVIDGETETGVCIMQLDDGMDTGPVLLERHVDIGSEETSGELLARLAPVGAGALIRALATLDSLKPRPQDHSKATHARMLTKADGAIDFTEPAALVGSRIRGVDPWPGPQALLRGQVVKLFRARAIASPIHPYRSSDPHDDTVTLRGSKAGTVTHVDANGLHVVCGDGEAVVIREVQAPGRKRLPALQFAAGRGVAVGDVLSKPELG